MKKAILSIAVIAAVSFTSCKKDRVCTCTSTEVTTTTTSYPGTTPSTKTETDTYTDMGTFTKARKGDAKAACISSKESDSGESTYVVWSSETTTECTLK